MSEEQAVTQQGRQRLVVTSTIPTMDTGTFEQMQRVASVLAETSFLPESFTKNCTPKQVFANCFKHVALAYRLGQDPFTLIDAAFVVHGRLGYEGKAIHAIARASGKAWRKDGTVGFGVRWEGEPGAQDYRVIVSAALTKGGAPEEIEGTVAEWQTYRKSSNEPNPQWQGRANTKRQLHYRGVREWCRMHTPEVLYGILTDDEIMGMRDVTPPKPEDIQAAAPLDAPPEDDPKEEHIPDAGKVVEAKPEIKVGDTVTIDGEIHHVTQEPQEEQKPTEDPEPPTEETKPASKPEIETDPQKLQDGWTDFITQVMEATTAEILEELIDQFEPIIEGNKAADENRKETVEAYIEGERERLGSRAGLEPKDENEEELPI